MMNSKKYQYQKQKDPPKHPSAPPQPEHQAAPRENPHPGHQKPSAQQPAASRSHAPAPPATRGSWRYRPAARFRFVPPRTWDRSWPRRAFLPSARSTQKSSNAFAKRAPAKCRPTARGSRRRKSKISTGTFSSSSKKFPG